MMYPYVKNVLLTAPNSDHDTISKY